MNTVSRRGSVRIQHGLASAARLCAAWAVPSIAAALLSPVAAADGPPRVLVDDLRLVLFAEAPQIVTPTALVVLDDDTVAVIECHTHFRPADYQGPPADRIQLLRDTDGDGAADQVKTLYQGSQATMGLAWDPTSRQLFVATRNDVFRLDDRDADGLPDSRTDLLALITEGNYPHNGLSGLALDHQGGLLVGLGENLGAPYELVAADQSRLAGGGEGGRIVRISREGAQLSAVATGFWNPFALVVDPLGRLFAVDNDPDSRPPCRLLHVVMGGDYGYRYRYGRKGLHPFNAWNGELPGTLPMIAGTGEAPSGLVSLNSPFVPGEQRHNLVVTSWGDHRLERYPLAPWGASYRSDAEIIVQGGEEFRPVGLAETRQGDLFFSDWVDKSYELHGRGRVWKLVRQGADTLAPSSATAASGAAAADALPLNPPSLPAESGEASSDVRWARTTIAASDTTDLMPSAWRRLLVEGVGEDDLTAAWKSPLAEFRALVAATAPLEVLRPAERLADETSPLVRAELLRRLSREDFEALRGGLSDADRFVQTAARWRLAQVASAEQLARLAQSPSPAERWAALALERDSGTESVRARWGRWLDDPDPSVVFSALEVVAARQWTEYRPQLLAGLNHPQRTHELVGGYLAALDWLDHPERRWTHDVSGETFLAELVASPDAAAPVAIYALRVLPANHPALQAAVWQRLVDHEDQRVQLEAVRSLRERLEPDPAAWLRALATDSGRASLVRSEAVVGLSPNVPENVTLLLQLASDGDASVAREACRRLRGAELADTDRAQLAALSKRVPALAEEVARTLGAHSSGGASGATGESPRSLPVPGEASASGDPTGQLRSVRRDPAGWWQQFSQRADAAAGERWFYHPAGPGCFRCHRHAGRGGVVGPDLTAQAQLGTGPKLLESLLYPSREIAPQFVTWSILTHDGRSLSGVLVAEGAAGERWFAAASGEIFRLAADEIESFTAQPTSLMPENLVDQMSDQELADLLAYLQSPGR